MKSNLALARSMSSLQQASPRPAMIAFAGGLDQETPPLSLPSGFCRAAKNYEVDVRGGYATVMGYERFDGRAAPSAGTASVIDITLTGAIAVGDTVTGVTSSATAVVIVVPDSTHIVVTKIVGTFVSGEVLNVAAAPQATTTSAPHGASTALLRAQYKNLAADEYRADIAVPTGEGNSIGGAKLNGVFYCFRNAIGGASASLWKSSVTGWQAVALGRQVSFTSGGTYTIAEGDTITGATSTRTAVITRVVLTSGTWAAGTAAGKLIFASQTGGAFQAENLDVGANLNVATIAGDSTAISLLPGGRYEMIIENFGGSVNTNRIYGCDGVNKGFEFDGTVFVPIDTGMTTDAPSHVHAHEKQLFFSFGGSVQHSAPGTPYVWSVLLGATEIGMGDTVTGFMTQPGSTTGGALAIFTRNRLSLLYGTGVANWQLTPYRKEIGAYSWSIQDVGYTMFLDDQGITNLQTSQAFGNFSHDALSARIKSWVNAKRTKVTASCVCRDKSQYRLFFSDGYVLYTTFVGKKVIGMMPVQLSNAATWAWSSEESDGTESIYFGSTNGMVYQMEKGTSFDGEPIVHSINIAWDWLRTPRLIKRFHSASLEVSGTGYAEFSFSYKLGYSSTEIAQPNTQNKVTSFSASVWNHVVWNNFVWNGQTLLPSLVDMGGEAENVSLSFRGSSDFHESIRFSGALLHYNQRRYLR